MANTSVLYILLLSWSVELESWAAIATIARCDGDGNDCDEGKQEELLKGAFFH